MWKSTHPCSYEEACLHRRRYFATLVQDGLYAMPVALHLANLVTTPLPRAGMFQCVIASVIVFWMWCETLVWLMFVLDCLGAPKKKWLHAALEKLCSTPRWMTAWWCFVPHFGWFWDIFRFSVCFPVCSANSTTPDPLPSLSHARADRLLGSLRGFFCVPEGWAEIVRDVRAFTETYFLFYFFEECKWI